MNDKKEINKLIMKLIINKIFFIDKLIKNW